jgi:hypothetical protein
MLLGQKRLSLLKTFIPPEASGLAVWTGLFLRYFKLACFSLY